MSENNYNLIELEIGMPIKAWTKGVAVEAAAEKLRRNVASMPFFYKRMATLVCAARTRSLRPWRTLA